MTPAAACQEGMAMLSGEMPPPESVHAVSDFHGPAALAVVRSVPPTDTTCASSAGQASLLDDHVELSPDAAKKFCPWAAIFSKYGSSVEASAGVHPHEHPMVVGSGLCVVMALMMAVSVEPMYITRLERPGAMPMAWVMSRVCSVSSQSPPALESTQEVLVPSVESRVTGTLLVCPTFLK